MQAELTVDSAADSYEQEADRVAERVMRMPAAQRARDCAAGAADPGYRQQASHQGRERVQTRCVGPGELAQGSVPSIVREVMRAPGQPLDGATRDFMESRFGHDFSTVRVHSDARAAESAQAMHSLAYTVGTDLAFDRGQYRPHTAEGKRLLAHELTHVVQQRSTASHGLLQRKASRPGTQVQADRRAERENETHPGQPLDAAARAYFEPRFSHDFSRVRVHTDLAAAQSAGALGASAYTQGSDIFFAPGRYAPNSEAGSRLLAHELAHVVQQSSGVSSARPSDVARIGSAESSAEREADQAAREVTLGGTARVTERVPAGTVQRGFFGSLAGLVVGAVGGALAGGYLFGGVGAVLGGIVGGIAGLIKGSSASANSRKLTSEERTEAEKVYGRSLNYDRVRVAVSRVMTFPSHARTPRETIYLPPDTIPDPEEMSDDLIAGGYFENLIHELCHVWQTQHGIGVTRKLFSAIRGNYDYGEEEGLRKAWARGKHFLDFGLEQQGAICADFYTALREGEDTSAFRPYILELRRGGRRLAPGLVPTSEPGDFPTPVRKEPVA